MAKGERKITIGDQTVTLRFDMNSLCSLEEALNEKFTKLAERFQNNDFGMKEIRALIWAGLLHEFPTLTLEGAGSLIDQVGFVNAVNKAGEAFAEAFGDMADVKAEAQKKTQYPLGLG